MHFIISKLVFDQKNKNQIIILEPLQQIPFYPEGCKSLESCIVPGGTFAITKDGRLVYARASGHIDDKKLELAQPYTLFRIASVSKSITSIAIMKLIEEKKLTISKIVFGGKEILNDPYFTKVIKDKRIYKIRVHHLLEHTAGWDREKSGDPVFSPLEVTKDLGETNPVTDSALIKYVLKQGLDFAPGKLYAYSNVGYLVLGRIIEAITDISYEEYVKDVILEPLGIYDMHIGKTLLEDKQERESEYFCPESTDSCSGDQSWVPRQYGGFHLEAMNAHGGWIATARDLVRLLVAVDGFDTKPDILKKATINLMTDPSLKNSWYAKGWEVNPYNNWWHTGSLSGTLSIWVRTSHGFTWAAILNTREGVTDAELDSLMWDAIGKVQNWPDHDYFNAPTHNATNIQFLNVGGNAATIKWENGDGLKRIVVMKKSDKKSKFPVDGKSYAGNNKFGLEKKLGPENCVVYNGKGNQVTVTNLKPSTLYEVRVYEFNVEGKKPLYLLGGCATATVKTQ